MLTRVNEFIRFLVPVLILFCGSLSAEYEYKYYQPNCNPTYPIIQNTPPPKSDKPSKCDPPPKKEKECTKSTPAKEQIRNQTVILTDHRAIIIASELPPDYVRAMANGVEFHRVLQDLPEAERKKLKKKISRITKGKTLTFDRLERIRCTVSDYYRSQGLSLVVVSLPEQNVTDGVVVILVTEARLGEVTVSGSRWFPEERYLEYISVQRDQVINTSDVEFDLQAINQNPWRNGQITYSPGAVQGTTNIQLDVQDHRPFRFFSGVDNSGFKVTQDHRLFVGFNWGNVLDLDQILSFQYTVSPDFREFQSVMAHYSAPLPWRDILEVFAGYSNINVSHDFIPNNVNKGNSSQFSSRYVFRQRPKNTWKQDAKVGFDYKRTNNDLIVGETSISNTLATVFQIAGAYETSYSWNESQVEGNAEGFVQPWSMGYSMSQAAYDLLRPNANPYFFYMKVGGSFKYVDRRTDFTIHLKARTQISSTSLLPLEQMGFGGMNSLRGYPDRVVNVDQGIIINMEAYSPSFSLAKSLMNVRAPKDKLKGLIFLDIGKGSLRSVVGDQPSEYFLASFGPGFRFSVEEWLQIRFDYGVRLTAVPFGSTSSAPGKAYFSVIASY